MDLTGLITFWALVIAAYAVLPEYWKFKLKAFVGLKWAVLTFVVSSALISVSILMNEDWTITLRNLRLTIVPTYLQITAYAVLFLYVLFVLRQLQQSRVTACNLARFRELLSSLAVNKQLNLIATVLKDNAQRLAQIYDHRSIWHRIIKTRNETQDMTLPPALRSSPTELQNKVSSVFNQIVSEKELTEYLIEHDISIPLLIVKEAENKISHFDLERYLHFILEVLISTSSSELYRQIEQHQNIDWTGRRDFQGSQLLEFLFGNVSVAQKWTIWKPIGDYVLRYLQSRKGGGNDKYNSVFTYDNIKRERFSDPAFIGLEYFDFMIKEALIQNIEDHMWLYYLRYWTEQIVSKLRYDPDEWEKGYWEFPTRYSFLLYTIVHYQLGWFSFALNSSLDIKTKKIKAGARSSILRCDAQCLANSLRLICESEQLPDKYKSSLTRPWWDTYFRLKSYNGGAKHSVDADSFLEIMITEIKGDIFNGAFRSSSSSLLLKYITIGLKDVDIAQGFVNHTRYKEREAQMEKLSQEIG